MQPVLAARIDRLPEREKRVLQTASVIGRQFSEPLLVRVAGASRGGPRGRAQSPSERGVHPRGGALSRGGVRVQASVDAGVVALGSQLQDRRRRVHAAVARAIEEAYAEKLDENAALVAHHWEEADEKLSAARWHRRAAEWVGVSDPNRGSGALAEGAIPRRRDR